MISSKLYALKIYIYIYIYILQTFFYIYKRGHIYTQLFYTFIINENRNNCKLLKKKTSYWKISNIHFP